MKKAAHFIALAFFAAAVVGSAGCVKKKLYRTEQSKRQALEAAATVYQSQLADRRAESAALVERVAELSKTVGEQAAEVKILQTKTAAQAAESSQSTGKLAEEKRRIEVELAEKSQKLAAADKKLNAIEKAQAARKAVLDTLAAELLRGFSAAGFSTVSVEVRDEKVVLTFSDADIFDKNGLTAALAGLPALGVLGKKLAERPDLPALIVAHTDNVFPKDKAVRDSWDWSAARANVLAKILAREHGANENQLTIAGRGEFQPVASNDTPEGRAANRRTEVFLMPRF